jgi:predicted aspartyl protease
VYRASLPIKIVNPETGAEYSTHGLIDTGADECAVPADLAEILGHNLTAGSSKTINTAGGTATAFKHLTGIRIYHPVDAQLLFETDNIPVDFMPELHVVLLGVNNFLSRFILEINYPREVFSIRYP